MRTRAGSRVLIDPLLEPNDDGLATSLAIAFAAERAWLQRVARRSLLVRSRRVPRPSLGRSHPGESGRVAPCFRAMRVLRDVGDALRPGSIRPAGGGEGAVTDLVVRMIGVASRRPR
jgi:hypothetical protein